FQTGSTYQARLRINPGVWEILSWNGLDNAAPYSSMQLKDSPHSPFMDWNTFSAWQRTDNFTSTLMYNPNTEGSIYVPISVVTWSWSYKVNAQYDPTPHWDLYDKGFIISPVVATTNFPEWSRRLQAHQTEFNQGF